MLNLRFLQAESRKVWRWYLPLLGVILFYVAIRLEPLGRTDPAMTVLAILQGFLVAVRVLSDPTGTQSFLWSRPLTRSQLFLGRWLLGAFFQALTLFLIVAFIRIGLRSSVQLAFFESPYYPGLRPFDVAILWPCGLFSFLAYAITAYLRVYCDFAWGRTDSYRGAVLRGLFILAIGLGFPALFCLTMGDLLPMFPRWSLGAQALAVCLASILLAGTAMNLYRYVEVES